VFFFPSLFSEVDNFIPANPMITPPHIVPEWYFLWSYAILRTISSKLGGVLALFFSIIILIILFITHKQIMKGLSYYGFVKLFFWIHVMTFILLTVSGTWPIIPPYTFVSSVLAPLYFRFYFLLPFYRLLWDCLIS